MCCARKRSRSGFSSHSTSSSPASSACRPSASSASMRASTASSRSSSRRLASSVERQRAARVGVRVAAPEGERLSQYLRRLGLIRFRELAGLLRPPARRRMRRPAPARRRGGSRLRRGRARRRDPVAGSRCTYGELSALRSWAHHPRLHRSARRSRPRCRRPRRAAPAPAAAYGRRARPRRRPPGLRAVRAPAAPDGARGARRRLRFPLGPPARRSPPFRHPMRAFSRNSPTAPGATRLLERGALLPAQPCGFPRCVDDMTFRRRRQEAAGPEATLRVRFSILTPPGDVRKELGSPDRRRGLVHSWCDRLTRDPRD